MNSTVMKQDFMKELILGLQIILFALKVFLNFN